MSEINVTNNVLRRHSVKSLEAACTGSYPGDVVNIHKNKITLERGIILNHSLYVCGTGEDNTTIIAPMHKTAFSLIQGNFVFKNLTIEVPGQSNAIYLSDKLSGDVIFDHVKIVHTPRLNNRDTWSSLTVGGTRHRVPISLEFNSSYIDTSILWCDSLTANHSTIGQLLSSKSNINLLNANISNSNITNTGISANNLGRMSSVSSYGKLIVGGNWSINSINLTMLSMPQGIIAQHNFKQQLTQFPFPHPLTLLSVSDDAAVVPTQKNHVSIKNLNIDTNALTSAYSNLQLISRWFNFSKGTQIDFDNVTIPYNNMGTENVANNCVVKMKQTTDKSSWVSSHVKAINERSTSQLMPAPTSDSMHKSSALTELNNMIGLSTVKEQVKKDIATASMQHQMKARGMKTAPISMHCVFSGNPGTGKTTVAKLFARSLASCGVVKNPHITMVRAKDLVSNHIGETAMKTANVIKKALGGVLFIDEAYQLAPSRDAGSGDDFNSQAVDELIAAMENNRDKLIVILAGYEKQMRHFFKVGNPGLKSRFTHWIKFPNYTCSELKQIFALKLHQNHLLLGSANTQSAVNTSINNLYRMHLLESNGRSIRNWLDYILQSQQFRLFQQHHGDMSHVPTQELVTINESDVLSATKQAEQKSKSFNG